MDNIRVWVHPFFRERNESGEYHHLFHSLRRHLKKFFDTSECQLILLIT